MVNSPGCTQPLKPSSSGSTSPLKRKRSTVDDNELPDRPPEEMESAKCGNFDFKEILDEGLLKIKGTVINRAPIMTAWAAIVAERLGFEREEALSIGEAILRRPIDNANFAISRDSICIYGNERGLKRAIDWRIQSRQR
jgi:hypothetical protein